MPKEKKVEAPCKRPRTQRRRPRLTSPNVIETKIAKTKHRKHPHHRSKEKKVEAPCKRPRTQKRRRSGLTSLSAIETVQRRRYIHPRAGLAGLQKKEKAPKPRKYMYPKTGSMRCKGIRPPYKRWHPRSGLTKLSI